MRRAGLSLLWLLGFAVAATPWAATRLELFANLAKASHALLAAGWFWALATALGWRLLDLLRAAHEGRPRQAAVRLLFAAGAGAGILAAANLAWGTFIGVSRAKFLLLDAILVLVAGGSWRRAGRAAFLAARQTCRVARTCPLPAAGLGMIFLGTLAFALPPTLFADTIRYHFGLTRFYEQAGRIVFLPDFAESNLSLNWQMLALGQIEVAGDLAAQAFTGLTLPLFAGALALAAPRGGRLVAVAIACSTPFLLGVSATANNDLGAAFFVALMWLVLREGNGCGAWLAAGCFGGLAMGTKYPAGYALAAVVAAALALRLVRRARAPLLRPLLLFIAGGLLGDLPWILRNAWHTGDPLYPALSNLLPWSMENGRWVAGLYAQELARYGSGMEGFARWLLAPWRATLAADPWFESDLGLAVWLALPLAAVALRQDDRARLVALAAWFHGAAWAAGPQVTRFLAAAAPAFVLAAAEGWVRLRDPLIRRVARTLMLAAVAANVAVGWMALAQISDPFAWLLRHPSRDDYLAARSPVSRVAQALARRTGGQGAVLLFGVEGCHFFRNPLRMSGPFDPKWIVRESAAAKSPQELAARLRSAGIRFLYINPRRMDELDRRFGYARWPNRDARIRFLEMARRHSRALFPELGEGLREIEPPASQAP